jgi:hypothetical protein
MKGFALNTGREYGVAKERWGHTKGTGCVNGSDASQRASLYGRERMVETAGILLGCE